MKPPVIAGGFFMPIFLRDGFATAFWEAAETTKYPFLYRHGRWFARGLFGKRVLFSNKPRTILEQTSNSRTFFSKKRHRDRTFRYILGQ